MSCAMFELIFKYLAGQLETEPRQRRFLLGVFSYSMLIFLGITTVFFCYLIFHLIRGGDFVFNGYFSVVDGKIIVGTLPKDPISRKLGSKEDFKNSVRPNISTNFFETGYVKIKDCLSEAENLTKILSLKFADRDEEKIWGYYGKDDDDAGIIILRCVSVGSSFYIMGISQSRSNIDSFSALQSVYQLYAGKYSAEKRTNFSGNIHDFGTKSDWMEIYDLEDDKCIEVSMEAFASMKIEAKKINNGDVYFYFSDEKMQGWLYCFPTFYAGKLIFYDVKSFDYSYAGVISAKIYSELRKRFSAIVMDSKVEMKLDLSEKFLKDITIAECQQRASKLLQDSQLNVSIKDGLIVGSHTHPFKAIVSCKETLGRSGVNVIASISALDRKYRDTPDSTTIIDGILHPK